MRHMLGDKQFGMQISDWLHTILIIEIIPCEFIHTPFIDTYEKLVLKVGERQYHSVSYSSESFLCLPWPI
jgi:hypothetical protein